MAINLSASASGGGFVIELLLTNDDDLIFQNVTDWTISEGVLAIEKASHPYSMHVFPLSQIAEMKIINPIAAS
jgi:uncharacterized protein (DUF1919 family)